MTVIPMLVGIAVTIPLWGTQAHLEFFTAATQVLAVAAVGMALSGRFFRLATHVHEGVAGAYVLLNVVGVLGATGLGLFFSFRALAVGRAQAPDLAITAGALASSLAAFGVQAFFGTPGIRDDV